MGRNGFGWVLLVVLATAAIRLLYVYAPFIGATPLRPGDQDGPAIVALLRPEDCGTHDGLIGLLNLAAERGVTVVGLLVDERGRMQSGGLDGMVNAVSFQIVEDRALIRRFVRTMVRLGYRSTPLVALIDDGGRIRAVVPPSPDMVVHTRAVHRLMDRELSTFNSESR